MREAREKKEIAAVLTHDQAVFAMIKNILYSAHCLRADPTPARVEQFAILREITVVIIDGYLNKDDRRLLFLLNNPDLEISEVGALLEDPENWPASIALLKYLAGLNVNGLLIFFLLRDASESLTYCLGKIGAHWVFPRQMFGGDTSLLTVIETFRAQYEEPAEA